MNCQDTQHSESTGELSDSSLATSTKSDESVGGNLSSDKLTSTNNCNNKLDVSQIKESGQDTIIAVGRRVLPRFSRSLDYDNMRNEAIRSENSRWSSLMVSEEANSKHLLKRNVMLIERTNLTNIMKLIVKDLIESSMKNGRTINFEDVSLSNFFVTLEHILRHGLKAKKSLLGNKKDLWNIIELVERLNPDARDITTSSKSLPSVKTSLGHVRAWLRLALMQKKLADYFKVLIENKGSVLDEHYENDALLQSEEAIIIGGLLVGLNILDCNLCIKGEELDSQTMILDLSLYLKDIKNLNKLKDEDDTDGSSNNMTAILDQKNYLEELNKHLNSTILNLRQEIDQLKNENMFLKGASKLLKPLNKIEVNEQLTDQVNCKTNDQMVKESEVKRNEDLEQNSAAELSSTELKELEKKLNDELENKEKLSKDLDIITSLKSESETARQLLERDVHEKQDTIISLRKQLEDVKSINLQMYSKLQECEVALKNKEERINYLEERSASLANTVLQLETKLVQSEKRRGTVEDVNQRLNDQLSNREKQSLTTENDLKSERQVHNSLRTIIDEQQEQITALQEELETLKPALAEMETFKKNYDDLQNRCKEYELSLEEIGLQLQDSQLEVDHLKENSGRMKEAVWTSDKEAASCRLCNKQFSMARRRHHCRNCGAIFCNDCSSYRMPLPSSSKPVRVCDYCHTLLLERYSMT